MLKSKIETVHLVDVADLADFLKIQYNLENRPALEAMEETSSDDVKVYDVVAEVLDDYDMKKVEQFTKTGYAAWSLGLLLTDQCNQGFLAPGKYVIEF